MNNVVSILQDPGFWQNGCFLRSVDAKGNVVVRLWQGPWVSLSEKPAQVEKNFVNSIGCMDFFDSQLEWLQAEKGCTQLSLQQVLDALASLPNSSNEDFTAKDFSTPAPGPFAAAFTEIMRRIHRGEIDKAVPMINVHSERRPTAVDRQRWMLRLLQSPQSLHAFGFWREDSGIMGATPEILFAQDQDQLQTMALAGTLAKTPTTDLRSFNQDPKESNEHALVVRDLQTQLEKFGLVKTGERQLMELPTLYHLYTPIEVQLGRMRPTQELAGDLIKHLHPTPALGVSPRKYGFRWMQDLPEQQSRGPYGAPIVLPLGPDSMVSLVQIRSLRWSAKETTISVGCGVVADSQLEKEWAELQQKLHSVFKILGML